MELLCTCGTLFEAKRKDAKYCSPACRKAAGRVTDNPEGAPAVTDIPAEAKAAITGARKLQKAVDAVASRMHPCCKHCPGHPHARHLDPCRQGCA